MTTHILSLTYAPKIPLVKSGECTQTIRLHNPNRPKKVGDKLILHTWEGKPYRTKWDWRLETEISGLNVLEFVGDNWMFVKRFWKQLDGIAKLDGMDPPYGFMLARTLRMLNGMRSLTDTTWDIIRWPKPTIRSV